jgi:DNA-binding phage protein
VPLPVDLAAIRSIEDPLQRNALLLRALEDTRVLQKELMIARGAAIYELYTREGASKAARLLGISRAGLYKLIAEYAPPEVKEARRMAIANVVTAVAAAAVAVQQSSEALKQLPPAPPSGSNNRGWKETNRA